MAQGYSIFSQAQGPVVPISLFSDAATAGINAGNALPTPLTAGIRGAISGYATGLDLQAKQQENQIRQNQVDQLPVANELQQANLNNAQAIASINQNKAIIEKATQATEIDAVNTELAAKAAQAKQNLELINLKSQFQREMESSDPATQAQLVLGGKYQGLFSADPKLQEAAYLGVESNPYNGLNDQQRSQIALTRKKASIVDIGQKAAQQTYPQFIAAQGELFSDPVTSRMTTKTGQSPDVTWANAELVDTGSLQTASDGTTVLTNNYGKPIYTNNTLSRAGAKPPGFDVVYTDPVTKKKTIIASGLAENDDAVKKYSKWVGLYKVQTGADTKANIAALERQAFGTPTTRNNQGAAASSTGFSQGTQQQQPFYVQQAKQVLNLSDNTVNEIQTSLKDLNDTIVLERTDPQFRSSGAAAKSRQVALDTIGKNLAYNQFKSSPALQAQYTEADVVQYNKDQEEQAKMKLYASGATPERVSQMLAPFKAYSPAQLYYKKNLSMINQQLKYLENSYITTANATATAATNAQTKPERFLSAISKR